MKEMFDSTECQEEVIGQLPSHLIVRGEFLKYHRSKELVLCRRLCRRLSCNHFEQEGGSKLCRLTNDCSGRWQEMVASDHKRHY